MGKSAARRPVAGRVSSVLATVALRTTPDACCHLVHGFNEDASQIRRHNTPAVMTAIRDIARSTLTLAGWANTASGRRAHTTPENALILHGVR